MSLGNGSKSLKSFWRERERDRFFLQIAKKKTKGK